MTDDTDRQLSVSNPGPDRLLVWLEPWAEEFDVPVGSTIALKGGGDGRTLGEVEWTPERLVVWATAPTVEVFIDGMPRKSASAVIPIPDGLTKDFLTLAFADAPAARLGGANFDAIERTTWWQRARRRLGL